MATISLYYWAGARAAAGVDTEAFEAETVAAALLQARLARADPRFDRVLAASSVLVDGLVARPVDLERAVHGPVRVEVLPPFAGGAERTAVPAA